MVLFQIGVLDITPFIVLNTYAVSSQAQYQEWTDGNGTSRRGVKRLRLKGTFSVKFFDLNDYNSFLDAIEDNKTSGDYLLATAYDAKTRTTKESYYFIDYEPANLAPSVGHEFNEEIEITVTER